MQRVKLVDEREFVIKLYNNIWQILQEKIRQGFIKLAQKRRLLSTHHSAGDAVKHKSCLSKMIAKPGSLQQL